MSNDLGEYRIYDLPRGKYYLKARPPGQNFGPASGKKSEDWFLPAFYPGSPDESGAQPVELAPGRQLQGVDFSLQKGHFTVVRGHVSTPEGALNVFVRVIHRQQNGSSSTSFNANADGSFQAVGLDPGDYVIGAECSVEGKHYEASLPIVVANSDITGIELRPMPPVSVTGRLSVEGTTAAKLTSLVVTLGARRSFTQGSGNVHEDGSFAIRDVPRDMYEVTVQNPPGLFLKSVRLGSAEISESGLDLTNSSSDAEISVVLSANAASLDGKVVNENGDPVGFADVAVLPPEAAKHRRWASSAARTDTAGHFSVKDLAPGSYRVYAWQRTASDYGPPDPELFKGNEAQNESVDLGEGEHKTVQVKLLKRTAEEP
jgi:hypothetical protein